MHIKFSRERRQLIENDKQVVNEFKECYKKGVICITMPTDKGLTKQTSFLMVIIMLWVDFIIKIILRHLFFRYLLNSNFILSCNNFLEKIKRFFLL